MYVMKTLYSIKDGTVWERPAGAEEWVFKSKFRWWKPSHLKLWAVTFLYRWGW